MNTNAGDRDRDREWNPDAAAFGPSSTAPPGPGYSPFDNNNNNAPGFGGKNLNPQNNNFVNAMNVNMDTNNIPGQLPFPAPNLFMGAFQQQFPQQPQQQQQQQQDQSQLRGFQGFNPPPFGLPQLNNFNPLFHPFLFAPTPAMMAAFQPGMGLQMPNLPSAPIFSDPTAPTAPNVNGASGAGAATPKRTVEPLEVPVATQEYMAQASLPPQEITPPQPLLVILDINGTLIYRKHRRLPPQFVKRPGLDKFLETLMDKYTVMIWSSSQPRTVNAVCERLFPRNKRQQLAAEWGRDKFGLTSAQYKEKIQVYKRLETVWADEGIQAKYPTSKTKLGKQRHAQLLAHQENPDAVPPPLPMRWDQSNTVLIDDSKLKAAAQPYNILEIPEFTNDPNVDESQVFKKVLKRLNILARRDDVSKMLRHWEVQKQRFGANDAPEADDKEVDIDDDDDDGGVEVVAQGGNNHENPSGAANNNVAKGEALDPVAEARKERRKARKRERKAARRATKDSSTTTAAAAAAVDVKEAVVVPEQQPSPPSPVSSVSQSGNFLLDRLEESLEPQQQRQPQPQPERQTT